MNLSSSPDGGASGQAAPNDGPALKDAEQRFSQCGYISAENRTVSESAPISPCKRAADQTPGSSSLKGSTSASYRRAHSRKIRCRGSRVSGNTKTQRGRCNKTFFLAISGEKAKVMAIKHSVASGKNAFWSNAAHTLMVKVPMCFPSALLFFVQL
ncbi:hypothetical protein TRVL_06050 [Trypanosoma vivax]|nr:hypothetical protein TRVL_06050 [Trypanosoma vivax]